MEGYKVNKQLADRFGVQMALVLETVAKKIVKSNTVCMNQKWYRVSYRTLTTILPCLTRNQIEVSLQTLVLYNILKRAELNENRFDRTLSYSLTEYGYNIMKNAYTDCKRSEKDGSSK